MCAHADKVSVMTGKMQPSDEAEGFGFIGPDGGAQDVLANAFSVQRPGLSELAEGQKASFDAFIGRQSGSMAVGTT